jgi:hypothetical protein
MRLRSGRHLAAWLELAPKQGFERPTVEVSAESAGAAMAMFERC